MAGAQGWESGVYCWWWRQMLGEASKGRWNESLGDQQQHEL